MVAAFLLAPLRLQGRIVETVTLGDWPMEWAARKQFRNKQIELRTIVEFVDQNPEISRLAATPTGIRASAGQAPTGEYELENPNILEALLSVDAAWVSVFDDQLHVVIGEEYRSGMRFGSSYTLPRFDDYDIPRCEDIESGQRKKIGVCGFSLSEGWLLTYEWYPSDPDELQRAIEEQDY